MNPSDPMTEEADDPLYVVTARVGDEISGCLAGFVTQSSLKPVRFIVCVSKVNYTFTVVERSKALAVHLLGSEQRGMASLFGEWSGDDIDKFRQLDWKEGILGAPVIRDCAAWVEGPIINRMSAGDHEAFLIAVRDGGAGPRPGRFMLSDASDFNPGHP